MPHCSRALDLRSHRQERTVSFQIKWRGIHPGNEKSQLTCRNIVFWFCSNSRRQRKEHRRLDGKSFQIGSPIDCLLSSRAYCFPWNWFSIYSTHSQVDNGNSTDNTQQFTEHNNNIERFACRLFVKCRVVVNFVNLSSNIYQKSIHRCKLKTLSQWPRQRCLSKWHYATVSSGFNPFLGLHKLSIDAGWVHQINELKYLHKVQNSCQSWEWLSPCATSLHCCRFVTSTVHYEMVKEPRDRHAENHFWQSDNEMKIYLSVPKDNWSNDNIYCFRCARISLGNLRMLLIFECCHCCCGSIPYTLPMLLFTWICANIQLHLLWYLNL